MIKLSDLGQVYIVCGKTDMRKGIDTLAFIIKDKFKLDPFSGQVFLFCGGKKDRFKALYWDGQGYWLLYKRFENGKLSWPNNPDQVRALTAQQVDWLMKGFSITPKIQDTKERFRMSKEELEQLVKNLTDEIKLLREQIAYLMQKHYGRSSEQVS